MSGVKETLCASCTHREVCSLKETYLEAQQAVDTLTFEVSAGKGNRDLRLWRLRDIPWISPVELRCKHYTKVIPTLRGVDP